MNTTIYYFSGTGNSLRVARDLASELGETTVVPISSVMTKEIHITSERIGIVFPVYVYGIPLMVSRFVDRINSPGDRYFFAVATFRAQPGGALLLLSNKLRSKGLKLSAGFNVCMPGNHIGYYEKDSIDKQQEKFAMWKSRLNEIAAKIRSKSTNVFERGPLGQRVLGTGVLYRMTSPGLNGFDKQFWTDNNCNGCGICQKVCPVQNVILHDGRPVWLHKCEQCVACLNLCPTWSIQFGKSTVGRERYMNPDVELKDFVSRG